MFPEKLLTLLSEKKIVVFVLLGLLFLGAGILLTKINFASSDKVEILESSFNDSGPKEIVAEIAGEVMTPGVYKLPGESRVEDLLVLSGGLNANADRDWVTKNINRAAKLIDGQKLYIPNQSEVLSAKDEGGIKVYQGVSGVNQQGLTDINSASLSELDKLPGIGPVYGQKIIEQRPYSNIGDLLSKGVIGPSVYEKIKDAICVY